MTSPSKDTGASPSNFTEFDFVIIGGGLSGLVLAARLSENNNVSVGVLETGLWKPDDPTISTPYRMLEMFGNPEYSYMTMTVPQKHIGGRQLFCPRGRVLGGGSSVNFMLWHRGSKKEYDNFEALGNPGWNFETIARAGRKSETFHPADTEERGNLAFTDTSFHGTDGPVQTSFSGWIPETKNAYFKVMENFGLVKNINWHNGSNVGIRSTPSSLDPRTGTRSSSATAYYAPNATRSNLSVLCGAQASKVQLEKKGDLQVAVGVHYVANGQTHYVKARKEVIISAGTLASPQILELSGVGNPSILKPLGIDVKVDNPNVGENLQDHLMITMNYLTKPEYPTIDALSDPDLKDFAESATETFATPSQTQDHGPLAATFDSPIYIPMKSFVPDSEVAEMKRKLHEEVDALAANNEGIRLSLELLDDPERGTFEWGYAMRSLPPQKPGGSYVGFAAALQHPFSRGHIHINSADPAASPDIDPHYLESSWDRSILVHGLQQFDRASKMEPLASMLDHRVDPPPGDDSREVWEKFIHDAIMCGVHWVGSVSMLPRAKGGVVDPRCKVYGTTNLRVVDASIIPLHVSAHIQATCYAVAERAAELIIEDHKHAP